MKKGLTLLLAAVMLSLAACATTTPAATTAATTQTTQATETVTEALRPLNLTIACTQAEDSLPGRGAAAFAQKLAELSGGTITCSLAAGGTMGTDAETVALLQSGGCDFSSLPVSALTGLCPQLAMLGLPFLFEDYQEARQMLSGEAGRMLTEGFTDTGLRSLGWMTLGFRQVTANQAISTPEDFQGLAICTQPDGLHQAVFQALGAVPTMVNTDELYDALEQGIVDGQEDTYLNISAKDFSRVQSHVMESNHVLELELLVISDTVYQGLTDEQRTWVEQAAAYAADVEWAAAIAENEAAKQDCIEKGMTAITLGRQPLVNAAGSVYDDYREQYGELMQAFNR